MRCLTGRAGFVMLTEVVQFPTGTRAVHTAQNDALDAGARHRRESKTTAVQPRRDLRLRLHPGPDLRELSTTGVRLRAGLELHPERWRKRLAGGADACDAVEAIATQLPPVVHDEEDDVAIARTAE